MKPSRLQWLFKKMTISIIAAIGRNRVIGAGNSLPWKFSADMKHFRELTIGKTLIMGSRTYDSIGKPLPGRKIIVLTNNKDYKAPGCQVAFSIKEALGMVKDEEVIIAGGASIYKQFLEIADKMYLTFIDADFEGDVYFPDYDENLWEETERVKKEKDEQNEYSCSFVIFKKSRL